MLGPSFPRSDIRFESTIRFIGFNAEEDGLAGSEDYVQSHVMANHEDIAGMVNDTIIDTEPTSDNDSFRDGGFPAILVIENSPPDFWDANAYYHTLEDASDRRANDPASPSGVTYDYAFAPDVVRAVVALMAREARLIPEERRRGS